MSVHDRVHQLILQVHGAALEGGGWITPASAIAELIGAYGVTAVLHRVDRPEVTSSAMAGYRDLPFDSILAEYAAHYHTRNPQALFERTQPKALVYYDGIDPILTSENFRILPVGKKIVSEYVSTLQVTVA
jgi:hypothetical protein